MPCSFRLTIDFTSVPHEQQPYDVLLRIERIDHPIVPGADAEVTATLKALVRKRRQTTPEFVYLRLD